VLDTRTLVDRDGVTIRDVACRDAPPRGEAPEPASGYSLVFVRRGCFVRNVDGIESVCEPTVAYCTNPGEEERFDHPGAHGDDCTAISLDATVFESMWADSEALPSGPLPTSPGADLDHRLLLAAARRGAGPDELVERAINTAARALETIDAGRVTAARPATARARADIVNSAREALAGDPDLALRDLSCRLAVSPHHLSRIFRRATGHTISRHRMRLRAREVLERLADGEHELARLAADVGFADQSHLCRVIQAELGVTPSSLRELLRASDVTPNGPSVALLPPHHRYLAALQPVSSPGHSLLVVATAARTGTRAPVPPSH
jgi:AraC-like DNA-binding protein